jgi:hypothetical protein
VERAAPLVGAKLFIVRGRVRFVGCRSNGADRMSD